MKHFLPAVSIFSLVVVCVGCSGNGKKGADSSAVKDSLPDMEVSAAPIDTVDSLRVYYSDDLKALCIKGDVERRSEVRNDHSMIYPEPVMELEFDEDGKLVSSLKGLYPKTNEDGFIYEYSMNEGDGTSWVLTYEEFNDEGYPIKSEIEEDGPQGTAEVKMQYYGYSYDSKGNWVMRTVAMQRTFEDIETGEKTTSSHQWKEVCSYYYRKSGSDKGNHDK